MDADSPMSDYEAELDAFIAGNPNHPLWRLNLRLLADATLFLQACRIEFPSVVGRASGIFVLATSVVCEFLCRRPARGPASPLPDVLIFGLGMLPTGRGVGLVTK